MCELRNYKLTVVHTKTVLLPAFRFFETSCMIAARSKRHVALLRIEQKHSCDRYGGPDSYQVTEKFNVDWGTYLVTNKSIIYATIDGRGSGLMDNGMLFAGYRNLGTVEIADQINVTR